MPDAAVWSEDDLDALVLARRSERVTTEAIAAELREAGLDVTRSDVLSRLHRLVRRGDPRYVPHRRIPKPRRPAAEPAPDEEPAPIEYSPVIDERGPASIVPERGVTGLPLRLADPWPAKACRFPLFSGETVPRDGPIFCGAPASRAPYCDAHRRLAFSPAADLGDPVRSDRKDLGGNQQSTGKATYDPSIDPPCAAGD